MKSKQIKVILITITLIIILTRYVGYRIDPAWSGDGFDVIDAFHSIDNNSVDVIVYGSSHAWKGFDTRVLTDKYGLKAYNYGANGQVLNTTQLFFRDSLSTQNPKVICIETYFVNLLVQHTSIDMQIYYSSRIPVSDYKIEYLKECFGRNPARWASYIFPLLVFHDNWSIINYENYLHQGSERFVESQGYFECNAVTETDIPSFDSLTQAELSEASIHVLDEIVEECRANNIEIIFYTCPYGGEYNYSDAMSKYAEENGCAYLDLFQNLDETGIDGEIDFNDPGHLNQSGAAKVADYIGEYIINNYEIE